MTRRTGSEGDRGDDSRIGADAHKARMAQRQVARDADDKVEGNGHDDVGRNGNQLTGDHARNHVVRLHKEHDGEGHDAHGIRNKVVTRLLIFKKLHNAHLHLLGDVLAQEAGRLDEQERFKAILELLLADCVRSFERLPIIQDADIIKNILCSGVWIKFNQHYGISTK